MKKKFRLKEKLSFTIIIFLLFQLNLISKERIAVMCFSESKGIPSGTGDLAANKSISKLLESKKYIVIERQIVELILKEQALQEQGCTDTQCAVKAGKLLSADVLLTGSIIRVESNYIVSISIRRVEDGKVEFAETKNISELNQLEDTVGESLEKFLSKKNGILKPELSKSQKESLIGSMVYPGVGHLKENQVTKGFFFASLNNLTLYYLLFVVPNANRDSKRAIKDGLDFSNLALYLSTHQSVFFPPVSKEIAIGIYAKALDDENKIEKEMKMKTLNSYFFFLANWIFVQIDLNFTAFDNYFFRSLKFNYFPEKTNVQNSIYKDINFSSRFELEFIWRF